MKIIKAFASHNDYKNNTIYKVYPFGEVSTFSLTYSKDVGVYTDSLNHSIRLYTFTTTTDEAHTPLNQEWSRHIFEVIDYIYQGVASRDLSWTQDLEDTLLTRFSTVISHILVGDTTAVDGMIVPNWIEWTKIDSTENTIRVYFVDEVFQNLHDDYAITPVLPLKTMDDFFSSRTYVLPLLEQQNNPIAMSDKAEIARDEKPETFNETLMFEWHEPNTTNKFPVYFGTLIYGLAGNNPDAIKDAITDLILKNSKRPIEDWKKIFPDLFKRTEFTIIPRWDLMAIPNRTVAKGIYSPIVKHSDVLNVVKRYTKVDWGYPHSHIDTYTTIMAHQYRSLQTHVISNIDNKDEKFWITDHYPDFISEHSLSQDFNRMDIKTRTWSEKLTNLIVFSENYNENSHMPKGTYKLKRDGVLYLAFSMDLITYLVVAKKNFT